ncbi:MAG: hypothetical protein ACI9BK_000036 [Acidimicrobiales bacterium]|jgi:hypothetical protein
MRYPNRNMVGTNVGSHTAGASAGALVATDPSDRRVVARARCLGSTENAAVARLTS